MKTTKKVVIALLAVALLIPLVIFPASANAPVNLAANTAAPSDNAAMPENSFPRVIAINGFSLNSTGGRLINGNVDVNSNTERWTMDAGNDNARTHLQALYAMAFPGATWINPVEGAPSTGEVAGGSMNIWVGIDFGVPTNFNEFVFYETNPHGEGQSANPLDRRIVGEFVIEVSNNPTFVPGAVVTNPFGTTEEPGSAYENGGAFNTEGWTVVYTGVANTTAEGFTGGPTVASFPDLTTAYRYVRLRTTSTIAQGRGHVAPNFTQIQVFNQAVEGTPGGNDSNNNNNETPAHVAVTGVPNVPNSLVVGTRALPAQANPATATHRAVTWTVQSAGTTGATINAQGQLVTTAAGTVVVTATVTNGLTATSNFTQNFTITITAATPQTGEPMVIFAGLAVAVLAVTGMAFVAKKSRSSAV